ncbi:unnamed protein product [Lymnaea stagnalis]|uniref:Glutaminyl-peptide cyclotransferase n=1 Tax=Lymnaea stagnalis TaxID=6523 RepID=A0AAV2I0J0_LYMST
MKNLFKMQFYNQLFLVITTCLFLTFTVSQSKKVKRSLRWVTSDHALRYLTTEMSTMEDFKSSILKPMLIERVSGTEGNLKVQRHITSFLRNLGWSVEEDKFKDSTPYGDKEFTNIIATFDSTKPRKVILACHFDSKYFEKGKFVAATDSAVPCAVLLETARQLDCLLKKGSKEKSSVSDVTLQLIFFDGEEAFKEWRSTDSLYGARHLAEKWGGEKLGNNPEETKLKAIREFILLDLIGTTDTQFMQQFTTTSELYKNLVKTENHLRQNGYLTNEHPQKIFTDREGFGGIEDDHKPFLERGVDILHLISTPFPSVWHKMEDDFAHLDFNLIDDFSRIFRVFISNLLHLIPEAPSCRKKTQTEL